MHLSGVKLLYKVPVEVHGSSGLVILFISKMVVILLVRIRRKPIHIMSVVIGEFQIRNNIVGSSESTDTTGRLCQVADAECCRPILSN